MCISKKKNKKNFALKGEYSFKVSASYLLWCRHEIFQRFLGKIISQWVNLWIMIYTTSSMSYQPLFIPKPFFLIIDEVDDWLEYNIEKYCWLVDSGKTHQLQWPKLQWQFYPQFWVQTHAALHFALRHNILLVLNLIRSFQYSSV